MADRILRAVDLIPVGSPFGKHALGNSPARFGTELVQPNLGAAARAHSFGIRRDALAPSLLIRTVQQEETERLSTNQITDGDREIHREAVRPVEVFDHQGNRSLPREIGEHESYRLKDR